MDFKVELLPWLREIAKLARVREIAKINTRKIIGIPKSQNFVLAKNSNEFRMTWVASQRHFVSTHCQG